MPKLKLTLLRHIPPHLIPLRLILLHLIPLRPIPIPQYKGLDAYFGGLERYVGTPSPDIFNAMVSGGG